MTAGRSPTRQTLVALLRGVNVGGRNALPMANLRAMAEQLGFAPVSTYLQSGNLVFGAPNGPTAPIVSALERAIGHALGREARILLRSADELAQLVAGNPFTIEHADSAGLHVTFLSSAPDPGRVRALPTATGGDDYRVSTREIYLRCPTGYGRTTLNNAFWERWLGVGATTRNWKTVTALAQLAAAASSA